MINRIILVLVMLSLLMAAIQMQAHREQDMAALHAKLDTLIKRTNPETGP